MAVREQMKKEDGGDGFSNFKIELWKYQGEKGALIPLLQCGPGDIRVYPGIGDRSHK